MGILFTRMFSSLFSNKEARILVLGLDNAGKTTILYRLQMGEVVSTIPKLLIVFLLFKIDVAIGFNVETVQYNNIKFQVWDLGRACAWSGGQTSIRPYWRCYFPNTQAIIYVIDSSDTDRLVIAKMNFMQYWSMGLFGGLSDLSSKDVLLLYDSDLEILANNYYEFSVDLPGALDDAAVTEALELHKIKNRQWAIFKTSAVKGEGLFEGLDWSKCFQVSTSEDIACEEHMANLNDSHEVKFTL
ncbi:hypothetical protein JRO89_XS06G0149200 [Xanthoceras sorbifolium]|uniref:ADP-ribosylation factor n=1 Tax=Xanthoceras sorbifolium TaxID=99658 RepID=A0ABQ8HYA5_9ROSI|nr:hypothetical protein JRO89_XS06G0149200 [Xanthoceras sorbifolium]